MQDNSFQASANLKERFLVLLLPYDKYVNKQVIQVRCNTSICSVVDHRAVESENDTTVMEIKQNGAEDGYQVLILTGVKSAPKPVKSRAHLV
jgi:hypothetical protein